MHRIPSDKHYIDGLLQFPFAGVNPRPVVERMPLDFWICSDERLIGDWLTSVWDLAATNADYRGESYLLLPTEYSRKLGGVDVQVDFGMRLPAKSGTLWASLVPESVPLGQWTNSPEIIALTADLARDQTVETPKAPCIVHFQSLTPGPYRLKLIWERHPPAGVWRTNISCPSPATTKVWRTTL